MMMPTILQKIEKYNPAVIQGYPSSLYIMSRWISNNNYPIKLKLKAILTSSENLYDFQEVMFNTLLPLYLRNRVFMTLSEAFTSEHAARMTSMSAATENAGELIEALTLQRNRERQAAITADLLDIVGGANAL